MKAWDANTMLAVTIVALFGALSAEAQSSNRSLRVWGGASYGSFGCWESLSCDAFVFGEAKGAIGGFVGIAKSIVPALSAGVELTTRAKDDGPITFGMQTASAIVLVRPFRKADLQVRGTFGIARTKRSGAVDDMLFSDGRTGRVGSVGVGYDVRILPRLAVAPEFEIGAANYGDERSPKFWQWRLAMVWR